MSAKVVVRNLSKSYGDVQAARDISFAVHDGEVFGLLGPNGAGKTTTLECILGLRRPDDGRIEVCGIDALRQPHAAKQKMGASLQMTALQDKITPREALRLFGSFYRDSIEPADLLSRFVLTEKSDASFDTLSGGQQQRLALALAFVSKPELIVLDEPTTGLDPQARRDLHGDIARMTQEGHTVLLTTHSMDEAEQLCDRIAIIDQGRIVATGTPRELISRSRVAPRIILETSRPVDLHWLADLPEVHDLKCDGSGAWFRTPATRQTLAELMQRLGEQDVDIAELHVQKATLEDVFIELTGKQLADGDRVEPARTASHLT